jgi:hypothetical protein
MKLPARNAGLAFVLYAIFTVVCTWPWARDPGRLALPYPDLLGHVWGIGWVVHQAFHDPLHLYDANMYWPQTLSLAYTESLFPQSLAAAPIVLAGGAPLLAHNLVLLLTYPLAAGFAYLLAWELTRSRAAAFLAGLAYGFSAYRWVHVVHIGVLSFQWLPLVLLLLRRAVLRPKPRTFVALGAVAALQALSSGYYAVLLALMLIAVAPLFVRRAWRRGSLLPVAAALLLAGLFVLAAAWPYRVLQERHALGRGRETFLHWSATPASYLDPGEYVGLPHLAALRSAVDHRWALFPGTAVLLLAPLGLRRGRGARLGIVLAVTGLLLSFGPELQLGPLAVPGPFEWLRRLPPISLMRDPSRLGVLAQLGLALLAALGLRRVLRWRHGAQLAAALIVLQAAEAYPFELGNRVRAVRPPPAFTAWLAQAPRGPVLELPWDHAHRFASAEYLYWSTVHWQPLVNGHGTFAPRENFGLAVLAARFPTGRTSRILRGAGIRYVVLHTAELPAERRQRLLSGAEALPRGVRLAVRSDADLVYEIDAAGETEPRPGQQADREDGAEEGP